MMKIEILFFLLIHGAGSVKLGDGPCQTDADCTGKSRVECRDSKCQCQPGFVPESPHANDCQECHNTRDCIAAGYSGENLRCKFKTCTCAYGYGIFNKRCRKLVVCDALPNIQNGAIEYKIPENSYRPPPYHQYANAIYTCATGYEIKSGTGIRICVDLEGSGMWSGREPVCEEKELGSECTDDEECYLISESECKDGVCSCKSLYTEDNEACVPEDIDECLSRPCDSPATCTNLIGSFTCTCPAGYTLNGDGLSCSDIDECLSRPCDSPATCTNLIGSFMCTCPDGYTLNGDGLSCTDIDECLSRPCDSPATCTNFIGSFTCTCPDGYTLNGDGLSCSDIDECLSGPCDSPATCTNLIGSFTCTCPAGYTLNGDGLSCIGGTCITSCAGLPDGDYQSCNGCNVYASCGAGIFYDDRPCPANLVWDDNLKRCEYTSTTCPHGTTPGTKPGGTCITSCAGLPDGDYQSCNGCNVYASCGAGIFYDDRPCPANLVWDDNLKRCEYTSTTCSHGTTPGTKPGGTCITSCAGLPDGDYQSCNGCNVYASCGAGIFYDDRACPANLVWDDNLKRCEYTSTTCSHGTTPGTKPGGTCITTCAGLPDGDYQSCNGCNVYASCGAGIFYDNRPCPANLVWDDNLKRCEYTSTTCSHGTTPGTKPGGTCITSCAGLPDGDYQSCNGCNVYASCGAGIFYDDRPCPANLVWDDNLKRCEYTSTTCPHGTTPGTKPGGTCITSCDGLPDGDYQSCNGCNVYASCGAGIFYDNRPCPANLVWDDNLKRCEYTSTTCPHGTTPGTKPAGRRLVVLDVDDVQICQTQMTWFLDTGKCTRSSTPCLVIDSARLLCTPSGCCITSCNGLKDGDYQSCKGCNVYASCGAGIFHDDRPCPANLVWDDNKKRCEYKSSTCPHGSTGTNPATGGDCITSCGGVKDGDYQSCKGCNVYASCGAGVFYDNRPCPANLVWDDNKKRCEYTSTTCPHGSTGTNPATGGDCITSCGDVKDGDYQSCKGCNVYASCGAGIFYDNRPCPANLVWDDNKKRCEYTSTTCPHGSTGTNPGGCCITSCAGVKDGDYQSCKGCNVYASCGAGIFTDNRPCPANLVWDDNEKRCEYTSTTCSQGTTPGTNTGGTCITSCVGLPDGDYQSCKACDVYASCVAGGIYVNRPCPANLVWDDNKKRCEYVSATCK